MNLGLPEILVILLVILLVFGPKKLPELSRAVGRSVGEFKRAMTEMQEQIETASTATPEEKPAEAQATEEVPAGEEAAAAALPKEAAEPEEPPPTKTT